MRYINTTLLCFILFSMKGYTQILDPVKFDTQIEKKEGNNYDVIIRARIEEPWHLYSQYTEEGGPLPTKIMFNKIPEIQLKGKVKEVGELHEKYEEVFMVNTLFYDQKVNFVQAVELKGNGPKTLSGSITFMACKNELCLPPQEMPFKVVLN